MSLRPSIYAADIAGFRALLAKKPSTLTQAVELWYREREFDETPKEIEQAIDRLVSGAYSNQPESEEQIYLVAALAHAAGLDSESAEIHWGNWKIGAYDDYFTALTPLLPDASLRYTQWLLHGRPLFGSRIITEWAYYSFLMADELRQLTADLAKAHTRVPELDSPNCIHGFPTEFRGWLRQVQDRDADLWLFAE